MNFTVNDLPTTADPADSVVNKINVTQNPSQTPPTPDDPNGPGTPPDTPQTPPNDPPEDAPQTVSYWGNVEVLKQKAGTNENLEGAAFSVYRCSPTTAGQVEGPFDLEETAITSGTTDENGKVFFTGLHANNFEDGVAKASTPSGYCLVETTAPDGTELQPRPIYFQVLAVGETLTDGTANVPAIKLTGDDTVVDSPSNAGFQLPLTGGNGIWMLLIIGGALVLVGGGYAYYLRREGAVA